MGKDECDMIEGMENVENEKEKKNVEVMKWWK